jgi:hypothetical protein
VGKSLDRLEIELMPRAPDSRALQISVLAAMDK